MADEVPGIPRTRITVEDEGATTVFEWDLRRVCWMVEGKPVPVLFRNILPGLLSCARAWQLRKRPARRKR